MSIDSPGFLVEEVRSWNTPLYGAYLLWNFTSAYCRAHPSADAPSGLLHFIALPILANPQLNESVSNRRANLQSYVQGFEDKKRIDILLSLHGRVLSKRANTLAAIDAAVHAGLLSWDSGTGKLYPHPLKRSPAKGKSVRASVVKDGKKAGVLGQWFAEHNVPTIAAYLKIVL